MHFGLRSRRNSSIEIGKRRKPFFCNGERKLVPLIHPHPPSPLEIVVNCILSRLQQKDHTETLQKMAILLLKALRDENFDHEVQQMSLIFSSDLHKFKLKTQLKALTHIVDEKQVAIKDAIKIILSLKYISKVVSL